MRPINEIIIHCAATKPSMDIGADWIRKIHVQQNKWRDVGYHFIIRRNGAQEDGRGGALGLLFLSFSSQFPHPTFEQTITPALKGDYKIKFEVQTAPFRAGVKN